MHFCRRRRRTHTRAHAGASVHVEESARSDNMYTANIQYYNAHTSAPGRGRDPGRTRSPLSASACRTAYAPQSAIVFSPVLPCPFPPLQGDVERRNARESYLSHIPHTCELSTYALSSMIFTDKFDALIQISL